MLKVQTLIQQLTYPQKEPQAKNHANVAPATVMAVTVAIAGPAAKMDSASRLTDKKPHRLPLTLHLHRSLLP